MRLMQAIKELWGGETEDWYEPSTGNSRIPVDHTTWTKAENWDDGVSCLAYQLGSHVESDLVDAVRDMNPHGRPV